jgi:hypothetical protein
MHFASSNELIPTAYFTAEQSSAFDIEAKARKTKRRVDIFFLINIKLLIIRVEIKPIKNLAKQKLLE